MSDDPYGTAALRRQVLDAWAASPTRFREDANAEEELVLGAYRDRLVVELAQNAADAALRAGVRGRLRVRLDDGELRAANTGALLDRAGVEALASLRASAKRDQPASVGRFGVGFAAVLSVTDEPVIASRRGGVRFSASRTREQIGGLPQVKAELDRRGGAVPVLRLPWPEQHPDIPDGFDTEVRLRLRPGAAEQVRAALDEVDPVLLLALPGLATLDLDGRLIERADTGDHTVLTVDGVPTRWRVHRQTGDIPPELLADRPAEERTRTAYAITWAVPLTDSDRADQGERLAPLPGRPVIYAPTPSDEPLSLPARLLATMPLASDRRHVAAGPLTDWLVDRAADGYATLADGLADHPDVLDLVPHVGIAASPLDARLCAAALTRLRSARWLPREAAVLEAGIEDAVELLRELLPGLLPSGWNQRRYRRSLDALGVRRLSTAAVVDAVAGIDRPPAWWRSMYVALATAPDHDALGALPVPLIDGRLVTGPRGLLLPGAEFPADAATTLGLRVVHPDAVHPLLERLGARPATARAVLADDATRTLVEGSYDEDDPRPLGEAVLALVEAAGLGRGELPWLAELALEGDDGDFYPAGELLLPGSALAGLVADDAPFGRVAPSLVKRWGARVLAAAGLLDTFMVLRAAEAEPDEPHDLDSEAEWYDDVARGAPVIVEELVAVRDLELVRPDAWPEALRLLAAEPLRSAVAADVVLHAPAGESWSAPSYTRWWLARRPVLQGRRPRDLRLPSAGDLDGLYDPAQVPDGGDEDWLRLLGCRTGLQELLGDPAGARDLLDRLGSPARSCPSRVFRGLYRRLAEALAAADVDPPEHVRVAHDRVVPAERVVVVDAPYLLPLLGDRETLPGGAAEADLLDLPLASELVPGRIESAPVRVMVWADVPGAALAADRLGAALPADRVPLHGPLVVDGVAVPWWPGAADETAGSAALGRMLAWQLGQWPLRAAAIEALARPGDADLLSAEDAF